MMSTHMPIATEREPENQTPAPRTPPRTMDRGFVPPDAANPGPLARFHPLEGEPDEGSAGYDTTYGGVDSQNQDRI
jgi:hypothetical protein